MNISRRTLLSGLALLPAMRVLSGQQDPPAQSPAPSGVAAGAGTTGGQPSFSTDVKVVNLFATVRNKQGKIINNLTKDDFVLDEEGTPQAIQYFSQESNLPLTLGLVVDTSGSQRNELNDERTAAMKFLDQILREDRDLAFVLHFDAEVELLQDLTASRAALQKGLDALRVNEQRLQQRQGQGGGPQGGGPQGGGGGYPGGGYPGGGYPGGGGQGRGRRGGGGGGGGTDLYDAILLASDEIMAKQKGRKALILLTDGVDTGSKTTLFQAIEAAQKSDSLVYSILFADSSAYGGGNSPISWGGMGRRGGGYPGGGYPGGGNDGVSGKKVLDQIARETGGRFFQVSRSHPLDKIFAEIQEELRNQYSIGFTPDSKREAGLFRHIHLTTKQKNMTVVAREGYYTA